MIIPNIWENKKCSKPPTSWGCEYEDDTPAMGGILMFDILEANLMCDVTE